jgi:hypothetical protein
MCKKWKQEKKSLIQGFGNKQIFKI